VSTIIILTGFNSTPLSLDNNRNQICLGITQGINDRLDIRSKSRSNQWEPLCRDLVLNFFKVNKIMEIDFRSEGWTMRSPLNSLSIEEYLKFEQDGEIRHEYVAGQIYAMAGASEAHNLIAGNIFALLRPHLRGSSCRAFVSDMKVKIKLQQGDIFYYPDLLVTCDRDDREKYFKTNPNLIVEVLSDSTETTDKREKRINYQSLDSLQEYVLVAQDEMGVEIYRRDSSGNAAVETLGKNDLLRLDSVGLTLTMADIYEDVLTPS
jgi:Uma2 family endonuclease